jgi:AcrR family transcriptional regulator
VPCAILPVVTRPRVPIGSEQWRRAWQRERRLLDRVRRAAWRREMAELERTWAIAGAHAEGVSLRKIAAAAGLGPTRVHAVVQQA